MKRYLFLALTLIAVSACGGDRVAELERELDEVKAQLTTSTTASPTTTTTSTSTTTTTPGTTSAPATLAPTSTTQSAPEAADLTGDVDSYTETLAAVLIAAAAEGSCSSIVDAAANELGLIYEYTYSWIQDMAEAESAGTLNVEALQEEAKLRSQKYLVFQQMMDQLVESGGAKAKFGADASDALGAFGLSLLTWAFTGMDVEAGTVDASQMQEFGMAEQLAEVSSLSTGIGDEPASTVYCP